ncbi:MAG: gliding motility-associated C-terminal domain-containing protein, partial [Candidatus Cloacimonetes bacterium]|nr:gliding motility-associated C-terminal domain-containing protein [Candidatus Cloacimonadota bacterium]
LKEEVTNSAIKVYNIKGQLIRNFEIQNTKNRLNTIVWDGKDEKGKSLSNGIYFYQIVMNKQKSEIKKMILMK